MTRKGRKFIVGLLIVLIFLAGLVSGMAIHVLGFKPKAKWDESVRRLPRTHGKLSILKTELDLAKEQIQAIQKILLTSQQEHNVIIYKTCPDLENIRSDLETLRKKMSLRIRNTLTPEQQEQYDHLKTRRKEEKDDRPYPFRKSLTKILKKSRGPKDGNR